MKKLVALAVLFVMVVTLTACGGHVYDADPKEFTTSGMTITLTEAFREITLERYTVCFDSSEVAVFGTRESFTAQGGFADITLEDYAIMVYNNNATKGPSDITEIEGLTTMEYAFLNEAENVTYCYFLSMYRGATAFWLIQFACEESLYEEYRPYFIEWAKTVDVGQNA